jgi:hypothetical protein
MKLRISAILIDREHGIQPPGRQANVAIVALQKGESRP